MRRLLRRCFEGEGFAVSEADREVDVMRILKEQQPELVTLDIGLGRESGLAIARDIRKVTDVPLIMVTAKDDVIDRVVGLEVGADDYIVKPFHVREVVARVHALLRRAGPRRPASDAGGVGATDNGKTALYFFDGMSFDPRALMLHGRDGAPCDLTTADVRLLNVFLDRPNRALSRDQLMTLTNGAGWNPTDRTIDNQIARLRKKIEVDPAHPTLIKTIRGVGYMLTAEVNRSAA